MSGLSSSSESRDGARKRHLPILEIWMLVSTAALMVAYLLIRIRLANYAYVIRWIQGVILNLLGQS